MQDRERRTAMLGSVAVEDEYSLLSALELGYPMPGDVPAAREAHEDLAALPAFERAAHADARDPPQRIMLGRGRLGPVRSAAHAHDPAVNHHIGGSDMPAKVVQSRLPPHTNHQVVKRVKVLRRLDARQLADTHCLAEQHGVGEEHATLAAR